ncbi:MAG: right-handed parallel beta-helix repeat-containing protein [Eubacterium sp.]|nr:right-handed parallel beta-helix repeat-containing protein [Eubacterium sp.]
MKKLLSLFLSLIVLLSATGSVAYATDLHSPEIVITKKQMQENAYSCIEAALKQAKDTAYDGHPVSVILPSGKFELKKCLHIYSNTKLILQEDTTLTKVFEDGNMLKCGKQEEYNYGYDGYKNITVSGGVWNEDYCGDSCAMRFAHCENVRIENVTIKKNKNSHHMEIAAAKDFSVINCTFSGYKRTNGGDGTALQIDPIHDTSHFPSYYYYDDTPCVNVTVKGCTFDSVYSGVGSFSGVVGCYFSNINITGNTFNNIKDKAISAYNYINSNISNNIINGATIGIIFELFPFEKLSSRLKMPNSSKRSTDIIQDCNSKIKNNTVNVSRNISRNTCAGIAVFGGTVSDSDAKSYGVKKGSYLVRNLLVSKNTVNVNSSKAQGMILNHLYTCRVSANSVNSFVSAEDGYNGITLIHSADNVIKSNKVSGFSNSVTLLTKSKRNILKSNELKNSLRYGITVNKNSSVTVTYNNIFEGNKLGRVHIRKKTYKPNPNTVQNLSKENRVISWTPVKKCSGYKILRSSRKNSGYTEIASVKGRKSSSFTDKAAKKGKRYYYRIAAYREYKNSTVYGKRSEYIKIKY